MKPGHDMTHSPPEVEAPVRLGGRRRKDKAPAALDTLVKQAEAIFTRLGELEVQLSSIQWRDAVWIPDYEAARRLAVRVGTLANWRTTGEHSLRWSKPGKQVMYLAADVEALLRARMRLTTSDVVENEEGGRNAG